MQRCSVQCSTLYAIAIWISRGATAVCSDHSRLAAIYLDQCELTVDGEAPCGSLGTDRVADGTRVLPGIPPSGWVDDQATI